ncbi:MAG: bifunctional nuclease family protein [Vicingaceae bacterium]
MKKIQLDIVGLSYSQTQSGAYALVLGEQEGKRRLPIIIGGFEAQAIAIELEDMTPSRPLTHDLFKSFAEAFDIKIVEVIIYNLVEGIFYAKLICKQKDKEVELDTRTSDAIALAVRFKCPIYTYEFILSSAGIILDESHKIKSEQPEEELSEIKDKPTKPKGYQDMTVKELKERLDKAIKDENYEEASIIKQELDKRNKS